MAGNIPEFFRKRWLTYSNSLKSWLRAHPGSKKLLTYSVNALLVFFSIILALFLLLQIDPIQNSIANRFTTWASEKLDTEVELDYISFKFFDKLILHKFYVAGFHQDTLLYADRLGLDFNLNVFTVLSRGLEVESADLDKVKIFLTRLEGDPETNIQRVLTQLGLVKDKNKEKDPFAINLKRISLKDVFFHQFDEVLGKELIANIPSGRLLFDKTDFQESIELEKLVLDEPSLAINNYPELGLLDSLFEPIREQARDSLPLRISVEDFQVNNAKFTLHNYRKEPLRLGPEDELNYRHLDIQRFFLDIHCLAFNTDLDFSGQLRRLSGFETSGFELVNLQAADARVNSQTVSLQGFKLLTPESELGDTLILSYNEYPDFTAFVDRVFLDGKINDSKVALKDIMVFAPKLKQNPFFKNNASEVLQLDGVLGGRINNLRVSDLNVAIDGGTNLTGDLRSRDITDPDLAFFSLRLKRLNTNMRTLRQLIPDFNAPDNFNKLGRLSFNGSFDGFFGDFVAYGYLKTALGNAEMDMSLKTGLAKENSSYSGKMALINFDMGRWLDDASFGAINFLTAVKNGSGFTGQTVQATIDAEIENLIYKGYKYENANIQGALNKNFFDGDFLIRDDNIDFSFNGKLDFRDSISRYDFNANIRKLDLKELNLAKRDLTVAGSVDLNLQDSTRAFKGITGQVNIADLLIIEDDNKYYQLESFKASSGFEAENLRVARIDSDLLRGEMRGDFDILKIWPGIGNFFIRNYPEISRRLGLKPLPEAPPLEVEYLFSFRNAENFQQFFAEGVSKLEGIIVGGAINTASETFEFYLDAPQLGIGKIELEDLAIKTNLLQSEGTFDVAIGSALIGGKTELPAITLLTSLYQDTLEFGLNYQSSGLSMLDNLNLNGQVFLFDSTRYKINFDQSNLFILDKPWIIKKDNHIVLGDRKIDINNFLLQHSDQQIRVKSIKEKGLEIELTNMNFSTIDDVWDYDPLDFDGKFNFSASTDNVFRLTNLKGKVESDTFRVNDDDWGALRLDLQAPDLQQQLFAYLTITRGENQLITEGLFNLNDLRTLIPEQLEDREKKNWFDFNLNISHFPFNIAEYFLGTGISDTKGHFNTDLRVFGLPGDPHICGGIDVINGEVTVDFLKTTYHIENGHIEADDEIFDATDAIIKDTLGNTAIIKGGIRHEKLKQLRLDANLRTNRFLAMDIKEGENPNFYGTAFGNGEVKFTGLLDKIDIDVNAQVIDGSTIVIPITSAREVSDLKFIKFVDKSLQRKTRITESAATEPVIPSGLALNMDLAISRAALMKIVFDQQAGDIIQGQGTGNIRLFLPRNGDFQMYGDYTIEQGDYLFTLYNLVNKKFAVRDGGIIQWSGDPYRANINLEAEYSDLSIPVANLIQEYLVNVSQDIKNEASTPTDVRLIMKLQGELLRPVINFDLLFPQLSGQLQSYAENKLRLLRQDQNELNKQVFGLIVIGQFFPNEFNFSGNSSDIIYNTLSEFVSNQLSLLLTTFFSEVIEDGTVLSGIDIDITYNPSQRAIVEGQDVSVGDELEVRLKQDFFNDRLSVIVGGNIDLGGNVSRLRAGNSGSFVGNDLSIEYTLNEDRSLKLRIYQRLEPDIAGGRRLQIGTGLNYRKEFNSFREFFESFKKDARTTGASQ